MRKKILAVTFMLAALAIAGIFMPWSTTNHDAATPQEIREPPRPMTPFTLQRHERAPLNLDALKGKWTFLFFGYTHCPDVCPTTLSELNAAHELLSHDAGILNDSQFVFVSVDPERDTPESLAAYVAYFNAAFSGSTGTPAELAAITAQLGIEHSRGEESASGYVVNHSSAVLLIDPQVRYYARLKAPHYAEDIRSRFLAIRRHYEENP
jgi:protein SCO1/2